MKKISVEELRKMLEERNPGEMLELKDCEFQNMDLCGWNLSDIDFSLSSFFDVRLDGCNFQRCKFENALLDGNSLVGADFRNAFLKGCCMRSCDMTDCDLRGANLFSSVLEKAKKDGWKTDDETKWYKLRCPEEGAFVGYKKCIGDRIVQLLIPADAARPRFFVLKILRRRRSLMKHGPWSTRILYTGKASGWKSWILTKTDGWILQPEFIFGCPEERQWDIDAKVQFNCTFSFGLSVES